MYQGRLSTLIYYRQCIILHMCLAMTFVYFSIKPKTRTFYTSKSQETSTPLNVEPIRGGTFHLRPMKSTADMSLLHEWTAAEGWRPGVYDALMFYQQDPTGCYLAEANGIPVGGFCVVRYGDDHAYGGQFIVRPAFREKRNGLEMAKKIAQMSSGRILAIDAVEDKQNQYKRLFGCQKSWRSVRLQGFGTGCEIESSCVDDTSMFLKPCEDVDFESLSDFDRKAYGVPRSSLLKSWISQPGTISFAAVEKNESSDQNTEKIIGYGCIRLCYENYSNTKFSRRIGPLFADSPSVALCIFNALVSTVPVSVPYYIDVPEICEIEIEKEHGLKPICCFVRMYINGEWEVCRDMVYGLTIDIC